MLPIFRPDFPECTSLYDVNNDDPTVVVDTENKDSCYDEDDYFDRYVEEFYD